MELILTIESSKDETSLRNRPSPVRQLCVVDDQGRQGLETGRLPIMLAAGSSENPFFSPMGADDTYFYCGFDPGNPEHPELCGNRVWKKWEREYHLEAHVEAEYVIEFGWAWHRFWHNRRHWQENDQYEFWAVWTQVKGWYEAEIPAPGLNNE